MHLAIRQCVLAPFKGVGTGFEFQPDGRTVQFQHFPETVFQKAFVADRQRFGAVAMQDWLDAQETRRTAEESVLENQLDRITNLITLYQALGGDATPANALPDTPPSRPSEA